VKYSFLLPYWKRESFKSTLISFLHHYAGRDDYEVVIAEDITNVEDVPHHQKLMGIIEEFKTKINIVYSLDEKRTYNSAPKYNTAFRHSSGQFVIVSNPENFHESNILAGLDAEFKTNPNSYVICSCKAVYFEKQVIDIFEENASFKFWQWYQHSIHNNRMLHFCGALSRDNYKKIGGFDERYSRGIAYEDNSFLKRVEFGGLPIIIRDDLVTCHIEHDRGYLHSNNDLYKLNEQLWIQQLITNDFFEKFV
jgi:hypothetical protein